VNLLKDLPSDTILVQFIQVDPQLCKTPGRRKLKADWRMPRPGFGFSQVSNLTCSSIRVSKYCITRSLSTVKTVENKIFFKKFIAVFSAQKRIKNAESRELTLLQEAKSAGNIVRDNCCRLFTALLSNNRCDDRSELLIARYSRTVLDD